MTIVCNLLLLYILIIFLRIVMSWFPINPDGAMATVHGFLHLLTEPLLGPLRRALPALQIGQVALDLSPIVVIFGLQILSRFIC
ncbi:MAG: YggT family protein [Actinomycetota bacterium]